MTPHPTVVIEIYDAIRPFLKAFEEKSETFQILSEPALLETEVDTKKDGKKKVFVVTERVCFETMEDVKKYAKLNGSLKRTFKK